jgi:hypothetical protein
VIKYFKAGFTANSHLQEVWLDGARLPGCIEARQNDAPTLGWASIYRLNAAGEVVRDLLERPETEVKWGRVEIRTVND